MVNIFNVAKVRKKTGIPTQEHRFLIFLGIDMAIYPK